MVAAAFTSLWIGVLIGLSRRSIDLLILVHHIYGALAIANQKLILAIDSHIGDAAEAGVVLTVKY